MTVDAAAAGTVESQRLAPYRAPAWLPGGHAQTIYPYWLKRPDVPLRRERVAAPDGDFWDFDWLDAPAAPDAPLVVLFHGLEGSSSSQYARALMRHLQVLGWRGVVPHFRGCSGELNRLPRAYHSGDHEEIGQMLAIIRRNLTPTSTLFAAGVSLGGSALLNWVARAGLTASATVSAVAAIAAPLDLAAAGKAIDQGLNRIYTRHFLGTLIPKSLQMAVRFPGLLREQDIRRVTTMWAFDQTVTAPLHGFAGADDYWRRASSKPWLHDIRIPALVINARNDPFVPGHSLPGNAEVSRDVMLEQPDTGGHAGFASGPFPGNVDWMPRRLIHFFGSGA